MIYRHYKGGLYFLNGYATPFSKKFYPESQTTIEVVAKAKFEQTLEDVDVVLVYDSGMKSTYYAYDSNSFDGVMCFYRDLKGQYWLRPREDFYKEVEVKDEDYQDFYMTPRFEKVSGEFLFDTIAEMMNNTKLDKC